MTLLRRYSDDALDIYTAKRILQLERNPTLANQKTLTHAKKLFNWWAKRKAALIDPHVVGRPSEAKTKRVTREFFYATAEYRAIIAVLDGTKITPNTPWVKRPPGMAAKRATARYRLKLALRLEPERAIALAKAKDIRDTKVQAYDRAHAELYLRVQEAEQELSARRVKFGMTARGTRGTRHEIATLKVKRKSAALEKRTAIEGYRKAAKALTETRNNITQLTERIAEMDRG